MWVWMSAGEAATPSALPGSREPEWAGGPSLRYQESRMSILRRLVRGEKRLTQEWGSIELGSQSDAQDFRGFFEPQIEVCPSTTDSKWV